MTYYRKDAPPCLVVPRVDPRNPHESAEPSVTLWLPYGLAYYGRLCYWVPVGQHSEGACEYYFRTHAPRTPPERAEARRVLTEYRRFMRSLPADSRQRLEVRERLPHDWRKHAWLGQVGY